MKMNERITLLALKASNPETGWLDREKFAELIVRECMEQVRDEVQYEHDDKLADAVAKRVLTHFGVEE